MKNGIKTLAMWLIIGVIFCIVLTNLVENDSSKIKYSELITLINEGKVESVSIDADKTKATVILKEGKQRKEVNIPNVESFMNSTQEFVKEGAFELEERSELILLIVLKWAAPFQLIKIK